MHAQELLRDPSAMHQAMVTFLSTDDSITKPISVKLRHTQR